MAAENRLTPDQIAALGPGDPVTIECAGDSRRPRHFAGTVVRVTGSHIVVSTRSAKGVIYQEQYSLRDGIREGSSLNRAELINRESTGPAAGEARRRIQRVDTLYREWARNRADIERLRRLHAAIIECLENSPARTG